MYQAPFIYRFLFLWLEPFAAFSGSIMAIFTPVRYLRVMTPTGKYEPSMQVVLDQLAATYFLFAFNQAVVLRVAKDVKVQKAMLLGMLLCDIVHMYGTANAIGWETQLNPAAWRMDDWINVVFLYGMSLMRIGFLLDVGVSRSADSKVKSG